MKRILPFHLAVVVFCLCGCGFFDSGTPWKHGKYELFWIDDPDNLCIGYRTAPDGLDGLIDEQVYSVGFDAHYIVAKQHPYLDQNVTRYFYIILNDNICHLRQEDYIFGPFTKTEFEKKKNELHLPDFSFTLSCYDHDDDEK